MAIDVSKLIDNGIQETHTSLRGQLLDDLFQYLVAFLLKGLLLRIALVGTILDVESNSIENT